LGPLWAAKGHTVIYGSRTPDADKVKALVKQSPKSSAMTPQAAAQKADIVLLGVPGAAAAEVVAGLGDLKGKVIIDATNTLVMENGHFRAPDPKEPTVVERIQAEAPGAMAVKAFNTLAALVMKDPGLAGGHVTVPIAGNDAAAKAKVTALAKEIGLGVVDFGGLDMSQFVEELGRLYVTFSRTHAPEHLEYDFHVWKP
jgi:predicted dinucleotide-binding enzyme